MSELRNIGKALSKMFKPRAQQETKKPELRENRAARRKYLGMDKKAAKGRRKYRGGYFGEHGYLNLPAFGTRVKVLTKYGREVGCVFKDDLCFHVAGEPYKFGRYEIVKWEAA